MATAAARTSIAGILLTWAWSATARADDVELARKVVDLSIDMVEKGYYREAIQEFRVALEVAPARPDLLFNLGNAYYLLARAEGWPPDLMRQSIDYFHRFLAAAPADAERREIEEIVHDLTIRVAAARPDPATTPAVKPVKRPSRPRSLFAMRSASPPLPVPASSAPPSIVAPAPVGARVATLGATSAANEEKEATFALHYGRAVRRADEGDHHGALAEAEAAYATIPRADALRLIAEQQQQYCPQHGNGNAEATIDCYQRAIGWFRQYEATRPDDKAAVEKRVATIEKRIQELRDDTERTASEKERRAFQTFLGAGIGAATAGAAALILGTVLKLSANTIADAIASRPQDRWDDRNGLLLDSMRTMDAASQLALVAGVLLAAGAGYSFWQAVTHRPRMHLTPTFSATNLGVAIGGQF